MLNRYFFLELELSHQSQPKRSTTLRAVVAGYDCSFEQDFCGWTQGANVTLDWFREQPETNPMAGTVGPTTDHTFGNASGYYVTTRLPIPITSFEDIDRSVLVSPQLPTDHPTAMCADWWYMMHGTDDSELNVYLSKDDNITAAPILWRRSGDQGRHWQHGQLQIDSGSKTARIAYEVLAIWSVRSEVSLDDLKLVDGPCIQPDFYSLDCTFEEEHICGYSSDPTGDFSWSRGKGSTPSISTGPIEGKHNNNK